MKNSIFTVLPDKEPIPIPDNVEGIPPLPPIPDPVLRRMVIDVMRQNPYLTEAQLPVVIRYAETRKTYDEQYALMVGTGDYVDEDVNSGRTQPSGLFKVVNALNTQLQKMERDLAISTVARETTVAKDKRKVPETRDTRVGRTQRRIA